MLAAASGAVSDENFERSDAGAITSDADIGAADLPVRQRGRHSRADARQGAGAADTRPRRDTGKKVGQPRLAQPRHRGSPHESLERREGEQQQFEGEGPERAADHERREPGGRVVLRPPDQEDAGAEAGGEELGDEVTAHQPWYSAGPAEP